MLLRCRDPSTHDSLHGVHAFGVTIESLRRPKREERERERVFSNVGREDILSVFQFHVHLRGGCGCGCGCYVILGFYFPLLLLALNVNSLGGCFIVEGKESESIGRVISLKKKNKITF